MWPGDRLVGEQVTGRKLNDRWLDVLHVTFQVTGGLVAGVSRGQGEGDR